MNMKREAKGTFSESTRFLGVFPSKFLKIKQKEVEVR